MRLALVTAYTALSTDRSSVSLMVSDGSIGLPAVDSVALKSVGSHIKQDTCC